MATISNTPRPGYVWDSTDNVWYPIGVGGHSHSEIASTIADAKGDLIAGTAADTVARLAVGTNNHTLIADSAEATGLKYAAGSKATLTTTGDILYASAANTPARLGIGSSAQVLTVSGGIPSWAATASSSPSFTLINSGGTALTGATSITVSGISGKNSLLIWIDSGSAGANSDFLMTLNSDSTTKYNYAGMRSTGTAITTGTFDTSGTAFGFGGQGSSAADIISCAAIINGANAAGVKTITFSNYAGGSTNNNTNSYNGFYAGTSTISSVTVTSDTGNWDAGTIYVYGA